VNEMIIPLLFIVLYLLCGAILSYFLLDGRILINPEIFIGMTVLWLPTFLLLGTIIIINNKAAKKKKKHITVTISKMEE